ncbi:cytochrome c biogenesis protein CcdA [Skermanella sp. TT6]|uniref:Cytochrome c biogenesis protein CcdA n=1 Tax=Skermanella cutis TaxID=2775420 RepID=A0ABX7B6E9_9PROT|nr:cytochrome c biogenesis protein CcdA [Skermanella sp. TT6]QQP88953.1 cytochrome c biogenesis protein CcdA [Skermanella sp. TT6]
MGIDITWTGALAAGLLSFASPCVLPLVPAYLCFLGGVSLDRLTGGEGTDAEGGGGPPPGTQARVFAAALAFVLGFATVFVALGATASALGRLVADHLEPLSRIAGAMIVLLGLHYLGVFRVTALYRDWRIDPGSRAAGSLAGAYLVGLAFAFGWTPCVGPVLAAILFVAGGEADAARGALLLAVYAAGIGIPFLAAALVVRPFLRLAKRLRRHMPVVEGVIGLSLIGTGALMLSGTMPAVAGWLLDAMPALGRIG